MKTDAPVIGIPTPDQTADGKDVCILPKAYADAVSAAGGIPLLLPVSARISPANVLALCDGLLLAGGGDVNPSRFGVTDARATFVDDTRDECELSLARAFFEAGKPTLGICRGLQVMNVALGGTLHIDIIGHRQTAPRGVPTHSAKVEQDSRLHRILGTDTHRVNSFHHQALDEIAPVLIPTAYAEDTTVEGAEAKDGFFLGVQWHPECLQNQSADRALFRAFILAAKGEKP